MCVCGVHPFLSRVYSGGKTLHFTHRVRTFFTVRTLMCVLTTLELSLGVSLGFKF